MGERKSLVAGLKTVSSVDAAVEKEFVFKNKAKAHPPTPSQAPAADVREGKGPTSNPVSRLPLTTRVRADFAAALKKASLQRQLDSVFPNTLQDILEEALEPWLRANGYLN